MLIGSSFISTITADYFACRGKYYEFLIEFLPAAFEFINQQFRPIGSAFYDVKWPKFIFFFQKNK